MDKKGKILVVDDEPLNIQLISFSLKGEYTILTALNGHDAISKLKEHSPDLILLDVMMPDISGFDVCKIIKTNPSFVDIPVIFLTAMESHEGALQGLDLGAIDYLTKPVDLELLKLRVRNLVALKERSDLVKEQRDLLARQKEDLEAALARVKQLEGVIPICMYCKKIRDDKDYWQRLESYFAKHTDVKFTHSICPDCYQEQIREIERTERHEPAPDTGLA